LVWLGYGIKWNNMKIEKNRWRRVRLAACGLKLGPQKATRASVGIDDYFLPPPVPPAATVVVIAALLFAGFGSVVALAVLVIVVLPLTITLTTCLAPSASPFDRSPRYRRPFG
jgi:hypothetical protein